MIAYEPEPMITLRDGSLAYRCIYDRVQELLSVGYTIVVRDGDVIIDPEIDADGTEWLRRESSSIAAMLMADRRSH